MPKETKEPVFKGLYSNNTRQSNFELLRIIAMSMIIIHHFFYHVLLTDPDFIPVFFKVNPFVYCGVNLFFLISGWFSIKFSIKKLLQFFLLVLLFDLLNYFACLWFGIPFRIESLMDIILWPISKSNYWFLQIYLFLFILAPVVNAGLKGLDIKTLRFFVIVLTIGNFYSCCLGRNLTNNEGMSFFQGLYMYILGFYLCRDERIYDRFKAKTLLVLFIAILSVYSIAFLFNDSFYMIALGQNNSIIIICASVSLFLAVKQLPFYNRLVNSLGAASLGCYMLQDGSFGLNIFYRWNYNVYSKTNSLIECFVFFALLFITFWILAYIVTPLFKRIAVYVSESILKKIERTNIY